MEPWHSVKLRRRKSGMDGPAQNQSVLRLVLRQARSVAIGIVLAARLAWGRALIVGSLFGVARDL